ncbi:ABC transporter substrate-binding protein [Chelativorans xinjiangense]|uniref:ABC transporter substrate-binding protein n=1 Tax=Chelativorans xinjiangense TaxID=2681485 RepID=UPI00135C7755|nr:ABC transporter substrate-binding protein [Chelativorans xinjiangense]
MRRLVLPLAVLLAWPAGAVETRMPPRGEETQAHLVIESTTDFVIFEPILLAFQHQNPGVAITYRELTTNEVADDVTAACEEGRFVADLVISSSIDQQLKLVNDGCALPLRAEARAGLPDWARWREELVGLTFEPAVTVYNRAYFEDRRLPESRFELIDLLRESEKFVGKVGTYDIESSGVGYLFAFQDALQASTWGRLVESLGRNRARLFCCTADILDRVADGRLLIGYNVLGSYALQRIETDDRFGIVLPDDYTLVLARAAFVAKAARQPELAEDFIAFMLSAEGRDILSSDMRLLSPIDGAKRLAALAASAAADPQTLRPIAMTPALLVGLDRAKREIFLEQWRAALPAGAVTAGEE